MAGTKLNDENLIGSILPADQIYIEQETTPGSGVWLPFKSTITKLVTFLKTLFSEKTIQLDYDSAVALIDNTIEGQEYRIVGTVSTPLPNSIFYLYVEGIFNGSNVFSRDAVAVFADGSQVKGQYDLLKNEFYGYRKIKLLITKRDDIGNTLDVTILHSDYNYDDLGFTAAWSNYDAGAGVWDIILIGTFAETLFDATTNTQIIGSTFTDANAHNNIVNGTIVGENSLQVIAFDIEAVIPNQLEYVKYTVLEIMNPLS